MSAFIIEVSTEEDLTGHLQEFLSMIREKLMELGIVTEYECAYEIEEEWTNICSKGNIIE